MYVHSYTQGSAFSLVGAHPGDLVKKEVKKEIKEVAERLLAQLEYVCFFLPFD